MNKIVYTILTLIVISVTINTLASCTQPLLQDTEHHIYVHIDDEVLDLTNPTMQSPYVPVR